MIINKIEVKKGAYQLIKLNVSKLPSGTPIDIQAHVYRSKVDGPTVLALGGMHGDEVNGIEIVNRMVSAGTFNALNCGTVIAIPLLNVYGFINFSRDVPDGKDINRSFPGNKTGSLAARVARKLTHEILPHIDFGVDFHTGGASIYNEPQTRISPEDKRALELAKVFGTKFIIESALIPKSFRRESFKMGKSMLVYEGGESLRLSEQSINEGIKGFKNILSSYGMINHEILPFTSVYLKSNYWERASVSGIFKSFVASGNKVIKGAIVGEISYPYGDIITPIKAKQNGFVFGINNNPVVNQGDALFHIGVE